ncbi:S8 family peptidase [Actinoplanes nipponensis]|uniref:S8 family peptidase n=1 Tax=Actinoplanes nipponensis TaxID=135950 RepID=UPI001942ADD8|nr:S8/S53 family peptidase [Actinoplanes nipponensis]
MDELVVALPHLNVVRAGLNELEVDLSVRDENRALGLALVSLHGRELAGTARDKHSRLDDLLEQLRTHFRDTFDGWVPEFGKNREVETVGGAHVISGGGSDLPTVAEGEAEALAGGWGDRSLADDAYVLPAPETDDDAARGGPRSLAGGLPRDRGMYGQGATVAVCDTRLWDGGALTGGYLAAPDALLPREKEVTLPFTAGHATFVTGTVLRSAPGAAVTVHPTLGDDAKGTSWQLAVDLAELAGRGIDVINISAGFFTGDNQPALALTAALRLLGPQTVVVAAAGNHGMAAEGSRRPLWPAAYDEVVAVGALTAKGTRAAFSPDADWVQLMAPGVNVVSNYFGGEVRVTGSEAGRERHYGGVAAWSGTSFAAAWVSGLIAGRVRRGEVGGRDALHRLTRAAAAGASAARLPKDCI